MTHAVQPLLRARWVACALACAGAVGGCSLSQPYPDKSLFALRVPDPKTIAPRQPTCLRVEPVRVAEPFNSRLIQTRVGESQFRGDYYNEFVSDPGELLTGATVAYLSKSGPPATVLPPSSAADCGESLETTVTELYIDGAAGTAYVRARFIVLRKSPGEVTVTKEAVFDATERLNDRTPAGAVAALGRGYGQVLGKLSAELGKAP